MDAHHRLVWSTFTQKSDVRNYIWRADGKGVFYTLSCQEPESTALINVQSKPFKVALRQGDRLSFTLRANAVRTVTRDGDIAPNGKPRRRKQDVVMDHIKKHGLSNQDRHTVAQSQGAEWITRRGELSGFDVDDVSVQGYRTVTIPAGRGRRKGQPHFGVLDMTGIITVQDPETLISSMMQGFGSAKAFGCGLMMIRRT